MSQIIENSYGDSLKNHKIILLKEWSCGVCSQGKLITRPSLTKVTIENPVFLEQIQGECDLIHPTCGSFHYLIVLIDESTWRTHVCLLSTCAIAFARFLTQIITLRSQFLDYPINKIHLDNTGEFYFQTFYDYCISIGIDFEHPIACTHTQNSLAEFFIKYL